jgi:hypothetical protein
MISIQGSGKPVIALVIPTRGDREKFLEHAKWLIGRQTRKPDHIVIMDDAPKSEACDLTYRYRCGCDKAFALGAEAVAFWEDDDWYAPGYLEALESVYLAGGRGLAGFNSTIYYNIKHRVYSIYNHPGRASAMSTMVGRSYLQNFNWPPDDFVFLDDMMWKYPTTCAKRSAVWPGTAPPLAVGIKHGIGKCAGEGHGKPFDQVWIQDPEFDKLQATVDPVSFKFYTEDA